MIDEPGLWSWRNRWLRGSVLFVAGVFVVSVLIGFVWLPSLQGDFSAGGIWSSICRAAGVADRWGDRADVVTPGARTTGVVLDRSMTRRGSDIAVGLGATIALQCTICHGARGLSDSDAPSLAGQFPEVIVKQLADYRAGDRTSAVMQAFAARLSPDEASHVAAYYAYLPKPVDATNAKVPTLVRVGDPMRNIAPCASCHGADDHKLGAPGLTGMPKRYLQAQLQAFAAGRRTNDSHGQMRNMARRLTPQEIETLADYYDPR